MVDILKKSIPWDALNQEGRNIHIKLRTLVQGDYCGNYTEGDIKALLENGANPNVQYFMSAGNTIFMEGIIHHDNLQRPQFLVDINSIILNHRNNNGDTALHYLVLEDNAIGFKKLFNSLICKGADVNIQNNVGNTPAHLAADKVRIDGLDYLISLNPKLIDLTLQNKNGDTVLHLMCKQRFDLTLFKKLFSNHKVNVNSINDESDTPLHLISKYFSTHKEFYDDYILALLAFGADPTIKNKDNQSALSLISEDKQELKSFIKSFYAGNLLSDIIDIPELKIEVLKFATYLENFKEDFKLMNNAQKAIFTESVVKLINVMEYFEDLKPLTEYLNFVYTPPSIQDSINLLHIDSHFPQAHGDEGVVSIGEVDLT